MKTICLSLRFFVFFIFFGTQVFSQALYSGGRIAVSSDGNQHDSDDWAATALSLTIIANRGLQDKLVHYDYANHIWDTNSLFEQNITDSALGTAARFGFDTDRFHNSFQNPDIAVTSIRDAINASSEDDPLYFICAGPMEIPYRGILASDPFKRQYVTIISHSDWNDYHGACGLSDFIECHEGAHTKTDIIEFGDVNWIGIKDQNAGRFSPGSMVPWEFLLNFDPTGELSDAYNWTYQRIDMAYYDGDASDSGMLYYLFTGDEDGNPEKLETLLRSSKFEEPTLPVLEPKEDEYLLEFPIKSDAYFAGATLFNNDQLVFSKALSQETVLNFHIPQNQHKIARCVLEFTVVNGGSIPFFHVYAAENSKWSDRKLTLKEKLERQLLIGEFVGGIENGNRYRVRLNPAFLTKGTHNLVLTHPFRTPISIASRENANYPGPEVKIIYKAGPAGKQSLSFSEGLVQQDANSENRPIRVHPNPFKSGINVTQLPNNSSVSLYQVDGKLVVHYDVINDHTILNTEDLMSGVYFLKIKSNNNTEYTRLLKE